MRPTMTTLASANGTTGVGGTATNQALGFLNTTGASTTTSSNAANGTFATDGTEALNLNSSNTFSLSFTQPAAAFSFYTTDLGDANNKLTVQFFNGSTLVASSTVQNPDLTYPNGTSSVSFFGFVASTPAEYFNSVKFINSVGGDAYGFDQVSVGTVQQVTGVPEPTTMTGLLLLGLSALVLRRNRK